MIEVVYMLGLFLLLNSCYFLPRYFLEKGSSDFFPLRSFRQQSTYLSLRALLIRNNYDIFRISVDLVVLILIYLFFLKIWIPPLSYSILVFIYFGGSVAYQVYYSVFEKIYLVEPILYNDQLMIRTGGKIFFADFDFKNFQVLVGTVLFLGSAFYMTYRLVLLCADFMPGFWSYGVTFFLLMPILFSLWRYDYKKYSSLTFQSPSQSIIKNIIQSFRSRRSLGGLSIDVMKQNAAPTTQLRSTPNIYFIAIESYGAVLLEDHEFRPRYQNMVETVQHNLEDDGWHTLSRLTRSPVTGGASWLSYTTLFMGLNIRNQAVFRTMLKNKRIKEYNSFLRWYKQHGYRTYRLATLQSKMEIPFEAYEALYGIDQWILFGDLDYQGKVYGYTGSPPDQYGLWKADELIRKIGIEPFVLFFITQNSHALYDAPPIVEDWKELNTPVNSQEPRQKLWTKPDKSDYLPAIEYQLKILGDYIRRRGTENDIFILVGDHQPPGLDAQIETFNTPMHIITKNPELRDALLQAHFRDSMNAIKTPVLDQAGFYTLWMRAFLSVYGQQEVLLPEVLEKGIEY